MKKLFNILFFVFITTTLAAQSFAKDTVHINFGIGLGWPYINDEIYENRWSIPALTVSIERGFFAFDSIGSISLGFLGSYKYIECKRNNKEATWSNVLIGIMARFNLYYFNDKKFIPYAGVFGGIKATKFNDTYNSPSRDYYKDKYNRVSAVYNVFAGAKYMSTPTFGLYGELSYGFTYFTLGLYKVL